MKTNKIFMGFVASVMLASCSSNTTTVDEDSIEAQCVESTCTVVVKSFEQTQSTNFLGKKQILRADKPLYILNADFGSEVSATLATEQELDSKGLPNCTTDECKESYTFDLADQVSTVITAFTFLPTVEDTTVSSVIVVQDPETPSAQPKEIDKTISIDPKGIPGVGAVGVTYNAPGSRSGGGGAYNSGTKNTMEGGATSGVFSNGISWKAIDPSGYAFKIKFTCPAGYAVLTDAVANNDLATISADNNFTVKYISIKTATDGTGSATTFWNVDESTSSNTNVSYYANNVGPITEEGRVEDRTTIACVKSSQLGSWTYTAL